MDADILIHLWIGFQVVLACGVLDVIRRLDRRRRLASGEIRFLTKNHWRFKCDQ